MKSILALLLAVTPCTAEIKVYFSPDGGCTEAITKELDKARRSVLVQAYSFTSAPIAKAVVAAKKRGVQVYVILDKSQRNEKDSSSDFLFHSGVQIHVDDKHSLAHNKIMVIDSQIVLTGSFDFTKAAEESNAENLLVITDPAIAVKYATNWAAHYKHSAGLWSKGK